MLVRTLRPVQPAAFFLGLGLLAYAGCSSSSTATTAVTHPTMIEVAPENFLGEVPCASGPGLKRYVATLVDTNYVAEGGAAGVDAAADTAGGAPDFQLPSSLPTPCQASVGFGLVVAGRHYDVLIDGYDTDDLAPRASGSREMVSPAPSKGEPQTPLATPRWTARCTDNVAVDTTITQAEHCTVFMPADSAGNGSVHIAPGRLLGSLACGTGAGQIDHLEVRLDVGDGSPLVRSVPCSDSAEVIFDKLAPRRRVSAYVAAFSADGSEAVAGATCQAFTLPEAAVDADCQALNPLGTVRLDLAGALGLASLSCDTDAISGVTVEVPGAAQPLTVVPPDCQQPLDQGFAPGPVVLNVTLLLPKDSDASAPSLTCHAQVSPGQLVVAECELNTPAP